MNYKKFGKIAGIAVICIGAVIFLYGRMHVDYEQYEKKGEQKAEQGKKQEEISGFPKTYQKKVDENLEFDVEVVCGEGIATKGIPKATASIASLDQQKMYQYFMGESNNVQKEIIDNYRDINGREGVLTSYKDDSGCELWVADQEGAYGSPQIDYIHNSFCVDKNATEYNANLFSETSDLSFVNRSEAWNNIENVMEQLGIEFSSVKKKGIYSLDVETLQREEECVDIDGNIVEEEKNPNWSKDDEGYYYFLGQQFHGLPIYEEYKVGMGEEQIETSPLTIYQTKDGISYFYLSRWFTIREQDETYQLAPFEDIMSVIEEKYTGTVMTNPLRVEKAVLYEYPVNMEDNSYTLVPVWICSLAQERPTVDGQTYVEYLRIPINAVTGEEMPELEE